MYKKFSSLFVLVIHLVCFSDISAVNADCHNDCRHAKLSGQKGVWMPEDPVLFRPFIADPRQLTFSLGWRFNDAPIAKNVAPISYWDQFPVYKFCNVGPFGGQLEFALEGCLWAVFDPITYSSPLVNADYYVGLPITYAFCRWSFRLRLYHVSSHIGDEYLLNHPDFDRRNPSIEVLDFFVSNYLTDEIRLYGGIGWLVQQDTSFKCGRVFLEAGTEVRMERLGFVSCANKLAGWPFFASHFRFQDHMDQHIDQTYAIGYEFQKLSGLYRCLRIFAEYHDGYSVEGQFRHLPTNYFSIRLSYGY
jgi:hypothetical protein